MPLTQLELERAYAKCADLQRRLHAQKLHDPAEMQRGLETLADVMSTMIHVLDRSLTERKHAQRP